MKNLLELLAEAEIEVKKVGNVYVGFCPFHEDIKTPNFTVFPETGSYHCFACGANGDSIGFLIQFYGISLQEARERLGEGYETLKEVLVKKKEMNFKDYLNFIVSNLTRGAFQKDLPSTLKKLEEFDSFLKTKDFISYDEARRVIDGWKSSCSCSL